MKKISVACVLVLMAIAASDAQQERRDIVIRKGFINRNSYLIVCKGYPKEGLAGVQKDATAREAALINAQVIARDLFNDTVDPIRNGEAVKFEMKGEYAVVHYRVQKANLRARQRRK